MMPSAHVVLKNGTSIEVLGATSANWIREESWVGAVNTDIMAAKHTVRLVLKQNGDTIVGRFDSADIVGYWFGFR